MNQIQTIATAPIVQPTPSGGDVRRQWGILTHVELVEQCGEMDKGVFLINDLIAEGSVNLGLGNSGIGKSPLCYQMALCVASGKPFLGHAVKQGRVLYLDYENGLSQVDELVKRLTQHLELPSVPTDLLLWNVNGSPLMTVEELLTRVRALKVDLVIIDPISAFWPGVEEKNEVATKAIQTFREISRRTRAAFFVLHHPRKEKQEAFCGSSLENDNIRTWCQQSRGASALVNGVDTRLGFAEASQPDVALLMRGYGRLRGEIPATYIERVLNEDGEPCGYRLAATVKLLGNEDQKKAFARLEPTFRFKDAKQIYGKGDQATSDFLGKCIGLGLLVKKARQYEKATGTE